MNKSESKYFNTALKMNHALLTLLETKNFEYITIKEICERAGVNRSTFYLHYQNTRELLDESISNMNRKFFDYFKDCRDFSISQIKDISLESLIFIKNDYLNPYLKFISENSKLFKTAILQKSAFGTQNTFNRMFEHIFNPILERFHYPENERLYIMKFYVSGFTAVIMEWIENDCNESIEQIADIMKKCVFPPENSMQFLSNFSNSSSA